MLAPRPGKPHRVDRQIKRRVVLPVRSDIARVLKRIVAPDNPVPVVFVLGGPRRSGVYCPQVPRPYSWPGRSRSGPYPVFTNAGPGTHPIRVCGLARNTSTLTVQQWPADGFSDCPFRSGTASKVLFDSGSPLPPNGHPLTTRGATSGTGISTQRPSVKERSMLAERPPPPAVPK